MNRGEGRQICVIFSILCVKYHLVNSVMPVIYGNFSAKTYLLYQNIRINTASAVTVAIFGFAVSSLIKTVDHRQFRYLCCRF